MPVSQAGAGSWRLVAVNAGPLTVEFSEHVGAQPGRLRIRRAGTAAAALDIRLALRQVERGVDLPDAAFAIEMPADAVPITIEELRRSGPLRDRKVTTAKPRRPRSREGSVCFMARAASRHRDIVIVSSR